MSSSKFDIVVYGATGFTGQLIAEYLAAHYKGDANLKWAMAGRSKDKLASVRAAIGAPADTLLIVADARAARGHRRGREGALRGGREGSQPLCAPKGWFRADARFQGPKAPAGQKAA